MRRQQLGKHLALCVMLSMALTIGCGPGSDSAANSNENGNVAGCAGDADEDGICDAYEGRDSAVDTDSDGTPDYLDLDSDGDGIGDSVEWGGAEPGQAPVDSDADGTPDFRDDDSDDNGIPDWKDGVSDLDQDGIGAYADPDDDDDFIADVVEIGPDPGNPLDSDGDGTPDHQDLDSDGDTILDVQEGVVDSDEDGTPDYLDLDSDGDCIPDASEAGDADLSTPPPDTDADGHFDFRDADSDNDGLADGAEDRNCNGVLDSGETSPLAEDTDGDGVWDLIEIAAETDPRDPADTPQSHGNFVFLVPYDQPSEPSADTLEFATSVRYADLYFSFDRTGSMVAEFDAMSQNLPTIIDSLRCTESNQSCLIDSDCAFAPDMVCGPNQRCMQDPLAGNGCIADLWTGLGVWDNLDTFQNVVALQPDPNVTATAFGNVTYQGGAEAPLQAPACVADGSNCLGNTSCAMSAIPNSTCAGYRDNAIRILIQVTDADDQCSGSRCSIFDAAFTGAELIAKEIKFIGLYGTGDSGGTGTPQSIAEDIGIASGTVDTNGMPFVYPAIDQAVVAQTVQAVLDIVRSKTLNVTIDAEDLPGDAGDALRFIDYLEANVSGTGNCTVVSDVSDTDSDGHDDAFPTLLPGTSVCWDVHPVATNDFEEATSEPKVFKAMLTVHGDGSPLDTRTIYFLVPPRIEGPGGVQ